MFTEESDPIVDMGIGAIVVNKPIKSYSKYILEEIYLRIRGTKNVIVYGKKLIDMSYNDRVSFNNDVVGALNCIYRKENREKARSKGFAKGDVLMFKIEGEKYLAGFSEIDNKGRIRCYSWSREFILSPDNEIIKVSKKKEKEFFENYENERKEHERKEEEQMKRINEIFNKKSKI
jgi:hypothetical protein